MKIAIYGAYGYQGRLVLAELARLRADLILVGRNADRLTNAATGLSGAETRVANLADHDGLVAAFRGADAVINCAGPFTPQGNAVARAAIAAGCNYTDTSGEQLHVKHIYDTCAAEAERGRRHGHTRDDRQRRTRRPLGARAGRPSRCRTAGGSPCRAPHHRIPGYVPWLDALPLRNI